MHRRLALALVLVASAALMLSACGSSNSQTAKNNACTARDAVRKQVDSIRTSRPATRRRSSSRPW